MSASTDHRELHGRLLRLVSDLWFDIDHHDGTGAHLFFTPDAELWFRDHRVAGRDAIAAVYTDRANRGPRVSRHLVTDLHLRRTAPTSVHATSSLVLFAADGAAPVPATAPAMVGDVHDQFEVHDDEWLIRARRIDYLFIAPDTHLPVPDDHPLESDTP